MEQRVLFLHCFDATKMEIVSELLGHRVHFSLPLGANSANLFVRAIIVVTIPVIPVIPGFRSFQLSASPNHTGFSAIPVLPIILDLCSTKNTH